MASVLSRILGLERAIPFTGFVVALVSSTATTGLAPSSRLAWISSS
ncbi:hypothetical protein [Halorhabdus sp. CUG00001]|nr:hypothetical protein [Halorhabdus sp. CUG00001]